MSRLQTGTGTPLIREVDLDEVAPMALGGIPDPETTVVLDISETLPMVAVGKGLLERSVADVVENAVKHSSNDEPVLVSASAIADRVEVRVVDRGPGVPDEDKGRIFEPFQRYGDAPRPNEVGLGLAVRGFAETMGGTLNAEDTPGGGLTMVLTLPSANGRASTVQWDLPTTATS
ncbi:sensor protein KdpD [Streptomyces sp. RLB3-17]|nr:sensor protein KdpD [Streptomyces sp. RLB1-9]QDO23450.1 sensor protein KdpD [Streptomyces sp. S1A1-8]QDO33576.1 sensor protein KdpD [Streptomyces sp. S1A1-3]QDO43526.1 sensor protein KdpD [Streptomyces sp. RLB3-17]